MEYCKSTFVIFIDLGIGKGLDDEKARDFADSD
jgi:hypothetical protein